jgi:hypothetical protein
VELNKGSDQESQGEDGREIDRGERAVGALEIKYLSCNPPTRMFMISFSATGLLMMR